MVKKPVLGGKIFLVISTETPDLNYMVYKMYLR